MTTDTVPMPYTLVLTVDEINTLRWMEARGYAADIVKYATETHEDETTGVVTLKYRESDAWAVHDGAVKPNGEIDDDFGACAGVELRRKLFTFLDAIV